MKTFDDLLHEFRASIPKFEQLGIAVEGSYIKWCYQNFRWLEVYSNEVETEILTYYKDDFKAWLKLQQ